MSAQSATNDFNADNKSDIVLRDALGQVINWQMNGFVITANPVVTLNGVAQLVSTTWTVTGVGDFDGDGNPDILWRDMTSGAVKIWRMNGTAIASSLAVTSGSTALTMPATWSVAGIGDFNADGKADILWRGPAGEVVIWPMNGAAVKDNVVTVMTVPTTWTIAGVGDFNRDGTTDILWLSSAGQVKIWWMKNNAVTSSAVVTSGGTAVSMATTWSVAGVGDFDGDGTPDILWRSSAGPVNIWLMNGNAITVNQPITLGGIATPVTSTWAAAGVADFNGDGKADILWRGPNGEASIWLMNGTTIASYGPITLGGTAVSIPNASWSIPKQFAAPMVATVLPKCSTSSGSIALSVAANRLTGVAPLTVFLDATSTTDASVTRPFHEIEYRWNFGETTGPGVGTWGTGSKAGLNSRNSATGPVVAHVYETPGTYTVASTATDGTNTAANNCTQITVQDPSVVFAGNNTLCFSTSGTFSDAPAGFCTTPNVTAFTTSSFATIISHATTGKRLLLRRGETWTSTGSTFISATGPGTLGAYGTGALPKIQMTGTSNFNQNIVTIAGASPSSIKDWRVMDLDLDGLDGITGVAVAGNADQITVLRVNAHDNNYGVSLGSDGNAVVDSTITKATGGVPGPGYGAYITVANQYFAFMGNAVDLSGAASNSMPSHGIRLPYARKAVLSNNTISRGGDIYDLIKLHAPSDPTLGFQGQYSEMVVISDNLLGNPLNVSPVTFGPQNGSRDERVRDVIFERNKLTGASNNPVTVYGTSNITLRNNLCDTTGSSFGNCFLVTRRGIEPAANNIWIYNNSMYSGGSGFTAVEVLLPSTNVTVKNNLAYAPSSTHTSSGNGSAGNFLTTNTTVTTSNNSSDSQVKNISPSFTATPPVTNAAYKPTSGYTIGGGTSVPVWSDFFLLPEPSLRDIGAVVH